MAKYLSLLRGINVSGQKKILMADLKKLYENAGFLNVVTYIQSGNVIFDTTSGLEKATSVIEKSIREKYGFDVTIFIKTAAELEKVLYENPYLKEKNIQENKLYVTFLAEESSPEHIQKIQDFQSAADRFAITGKNIYLYCPDGYGTSKLSNNFFENKLKVRATTRNWKSVNELYKMVRS